MTAAADKSKEVQQIHTLLQERDGLVKQLEAAKFELNGRKGELAYVKVVAADCQTGAPQRRGDHQKTSEGA